MDMLKERLEYLLSRDEVTPYKVSKEIGISQSVFSVIRNDTNNSKTLQNDTASKLAKYFKVNKSWLLTGSGSMLKSDSGNITQITQTANGNNNSQTQHVNSALAGEVQELTKQIQELQQQNAKLIDIISQLTK